MKPKCFDCGFYETISSECRYFPPSSEGGWPQVSPEDWCGEFSEIETKEEFSRVYFDPINDIIKFQ